MSGLYDANAGGIFVSYTAGRQATDDEIFRQIQLMIYQLASYMNAKDYGTAIQNAAKQALGGEPQPGEISETVINSGPITGYFATDVSGGNTNADYHAYAAGINPNPTEIYDPQNNPNDYYRMDVQDLSIVLNVLQLSSIVSLTGPLATQQAIFKAALSALQAISAQLQSRAQQQGWAASRGGHT